MTPSEIELVTVRLITQRLKQLRTLRYCYSCRRFGQTRRLHLQGPKMRLKTPSTLKRDAIVPQEVYRNLQAVVSATTLIFVNTNVNFQSHIPLPACYLSSTITHVKLCELD